MKSRGKTWLVAGAATAAFATGAGYASIPSSSGAVNGCYERITGILRVIDTDAGKSCKSFETPISWSAQGPKGERGLTGPVGPKGDKGETGAAGPQGPEGQMGQAGHAGADGRPGAPGVDGRDGGSVVSAELAPGNPNCSNGGSSFTTAAGVVTYACNGGDGGGLAAIADLAGLACTTSDGQAHGSLVVTTGPANAIVLTCRGTGPCNGNLTVSHQNGLGNAWSDCNARGVPGTPTTYSHSLATAAANAWLQASGSGQVHTAVCAGANAIGVTSNGSGALWVYSGPLAGRVHLSSAAADLICPTSGDPAWG